MTNIQRQAMKLYHGPFRFEMGYIWDSNGEMVADDHHLDEAESEISMTSLALSRIRGWGRIGYMEKPSQLQDAVGQMVAQALTEFWERHFKPEGAR